MAKRPKGGDGVLEVTDGDGDTWRVEYRLRPIDGRLEPVEMRLYCVDTAASVEALKPVPHPKAITSTVMRSLNLGSRFEASRAGWVAAWDEMPERDRLRWKADRDAMAAPRAASGGHPGTPDQELQRAADAWLEARAAGRSVVKAVEKACHLSTSGANKRIARAREAGLIPPAGRKQ